MKLKFKSVSVGFMFLFYLNNYVGLARSQKADQESNTTKTTLFPNEQTATMTTENKHQFTELDNFSVIPAAAYPKSKLTLAYVTNALTQSACAVKITENRQLFHLSPSNISLVNVECNIGPNDSWSFLDFRNATEFIPGYAIALDLKCYEKGEIVLPWPMRANNLKNISVRNCVILDFMSEYYDDRTSEIPDTLEHFSIINCSKAMTEKELLNFYTVGSRRYFTRQAKCGPENATANIIRNSPETFESINLDISDDLKDAARLFYRNRATVKRRIVCNYNNLVTYDRSQSTNLDFKHLEDMLEDSTYPKLEIFNLSRTRLISIPPELIDWRLSFPKLKYLDLRYNNITDVQSVKDHGKKEEEPSVGVIDLRYNKITFITKRFLRSIRFHKLVKIDIRNNPFNCICEMRDFVEYLRGKNNITREGSQYMYFKDLVCANPPEVRGRRIMDLTALELGCEVEISTILTAPIISLCLLVVLLIIAIFIIVRYRNEIIILAFTRLNIVLPCHSVDDEDRKQYDAFVAYSQHDADWVIHTLATRLEKNNAGAGTFTLCLHHRDFAVGAAISDNIISSVENSRHTILIVSRNFLKSEWCLLEFRTALHQTLLERKKHLIIVLLEDISKEHIDTDLKRCLQTLTFVKLDDILFWDKLIYALSEKKKAKRRNARIAYHKNMQRVQQQNNQNGLNNNLNKV